MPRLRQKDKPHGGAHCIHLYNSAGSTCLWLHCSLHSRIFFTNIKGRERHGDGNAAQLVELIRCDNPSAMPEQD